MHNRHVDGQLRVFTSTQIPISLHIRKGPNKVRFNGILQSFRDAITLFKLAINIVNPEISNENLFNQ